MRPNSISVGWRLSACCALLSLCGSPLFAQRDRIAARIDSSQRLTLPGNIHPLANPGNDIGAADPSLQIDSASLQLKPTEAQQQELQHLLAAQQNPNSPDFHRWLSPEQYADRFGISSNDIGKITEWLQSQGLRIDIVARGRNWINFSATAGQLRNAFGVEMRRYRVNGEIHYANANEPSVPAAMKELVAGFHGLNDFRPKPLARPMVKPQYNDPSGVHYLVPDDIGTIYNTAPLIKSGADGSGVKIAVVGESAIDPSDIKAFRSKYNLPASDPQIILTGTDPGTVQDAMIEADIDIEWTGGVAPKASIIYVYSKNVFTAEQYAVDNNVAPVLSISFGGCETQGSPYDNFIAQQANAEGMTWLASSGDSASAACDGVSFHNPPIASMGLSVNEPANYPEVTGVGGTTLNEGTGVYWAASNGPNGGSAMSYIPEVAWNDTAIAGMISGSGGGASAFYPKPLWQNAPGVPADGARDVPDVSLSASPNHDAYQLYSGGQTLAAGGTSVSTPVFAGMVALLNTSLVSRGMVPGPGLGNINPTLYRLARTSSTIFHDITSGNNIVPCQAGSPNCNNGSFGYYAGPGYDQVTGLGSVNLFNLVSQWTIPAAVPSSVTATATPNPVYQQTPDSHGNSWSVTLSLSETAGGSTTLTGMTFAGQDYSGQINSFFGTNAIQPFDTIKTALVFNISPVPTTQTFGFSGMDPGGKTWSQQVSIQFLGHQPAGTPSIVGVSNGASFKTVVAPGMIMSVFGSNLATGTQAASSLPLPATLQGASATVNGIAAPLYFASPGQINLQIPYQTAIGPANVVISYNGATATFPITVQANAPGIFAASGALVPYATGKRGDTLLAFITGEGTVSPAIATGATPAPGTPLSQLPKPTADVTVTVGGVNATLAFVGIPSGLAGATQINFVVPAGAPLGAQPVIVTVGGAASPAVNLGITQ